MPVIHPVFAFFVTFITDQVINLESLGRILFNSFDDVDDCFLHIFLQKDSETERIKIVGATLLFLDSAGDTDYFHIGRIEDDLHRQAYRQVTITFYTVGGTLIPTGLTVWNLPDGRFMQRVYELHDDDIPNTFSPSSLPLN